MKKTLILAATILSLGAGAALANDGDVYAQPAQVNSAATSTQAGHQRLFSASNRPETSVYSMFRGAGYAQGGEQ